MYLQFISITIKLHKRLSGKDNQDFNVQYYHNKDLTQLRIESNLGLCISTWLFFLNHQKD